MFSKKNFLRTVSYGALLVTGFLAPMTTQARENTPSPKTSEQIMAQASQKYEQARKDFGAGKIDAQGFLKAEQDYASTLADHAPHMSEEDIKTHPLFKNRAPRQSLKEEIRHMTPQEITSYRTFLQKRVEMAQKKLPNAVERATKNVTGAVNKTTDFIGDMLTTPLHWVENGLTATGSAVRSGMDKVSEATGDSVVSPLVGTIVDNTLGLTGSLVGATGNIAKTAIDTPTKTVTNTLNAAATATRNPLEAGANYAADMGNTLSQGVGNIMTTAGITTKSAINTASAVGRQTIDSTSGIAQIALIQPTAAVVGLFDEKAADEIHFWGAVGRAGLAGHAVRPVDVAGNIAARILVDVGQGIPLVSEMAAPAIRGNLGYVSPMILPEMGMAVHNYNKKTDDKTHLPARDLKTTLANAALSPYTQTLNDEAKFIHEMGLMMNLRATAMKHDAKAQEKRTQTAQEDYVFAVNRLNAFDKAVAEIQAEKTAQTQAAKAKAR